MSGMRDRSTHLDALIEGYDSPPDDAEERARSLSVLRAWQLALETKDLAGLEALMHEDIVIDLPFSESGRTESGFFRVYQGIPECLDFWRAAFQFEKQLHPFTEMELFVSPDGSRIFFEGQGHVTMTTGAEYRNRYVLRIDLDDGRVRHYREYYNPIISAFAFGRPIAGQLKLDSL